MLRMIAELLSLGRRAFVQYDQLSDAVDFIQDNYPRLLLDFAGLVDGDASGRTPVYIHYARNREDPGNWTCPVVSLFAVLVAVVGVVVL